MIGDKENRYQAFIAWDQLLNVCFDGTADETISSRCYRTRFLPHIDKWRVRIDWVFEHILRQGPDHCKNAYVKEVLGRHLSQRFYDLAIQMNIAFDAEHLGADIRMPQ